jgi:prolyl 4-hydroxylase
VLSEVLDEDECARLIALAKYRLTPSTVVDPGTGMNVVAGHRSSYGMFFQLRENAFIATLDERISDIMNMPVENGEGIQVLYYPAGAQSAPHFDFLMPSNPANRASLECSGQRVSTLVTYLNDVEGGGETVFPAVGWTVAPRRGNAVYFEYCNSLNQLDHASLHAGNPVLAGEKWVATKWMRQRRFIPG